MSSDITVTPASDREIIAWWDWASKFPNSISPFQPGWGRNGFDRNHQNQPRSVFVFCLSCTAGMGGTDTEPRPLSNAISSGRSILIPIYVAGSDESITVAEGLLGDKPHMIEFLINGEKPPSFYRADGSPNPSFYRETSVGSLDYVVDNSFGEKEGEYPEYFSAGYWAKISSSASSGVENLQFGGSGGRRVNYVVENGIRTIIPAGEFITSVKYER